MLNVELNNGLLRVLAKTDKSAKHPARHSEEHSDAAIHQTGTDVIRVSRIHAPRGYVAWPLRGRFGFRVLFCLFSMVGKPWPQSGQ